MTPSSSSLFLGLALMATISILSVVIMLLLGRSAIREHFPADLYRACYRAGVAGVMAGSCGALSFAWALGSHQF